MEDNKDFEDDAIFSDEDISQSSLSKGVRLIPTWLAMEFISWLDLTYPDFSSIRNVPRDQIEQLISEFEDDRKTSYNVTVEDWYDLLQRR